MTTRFDFYNGIKLFNITCKKISELSLMRPDKKTHLILEVSRQVDRGRNQNVTTTCI